MGWTVWLSYVGNLAYMLEALLANNFREDISCVPAQIAPFSAVRDVRYQTCLLAGSRPGSLTVAGKDYVRATYGYKMNTVGRGIGISCAFSALYLIVTIIASETITWGGGASVTVFARTQRAKDAMRRSKLPIEEIRHNMPSSEDRSTATPPVGIASTASTEFTEQKMEETAPGAQPSDRPVLSWKNVTLTLDSGRELLHHISGMAVPGELVACVYIPSFTSSFAC